MADDAAWIENLSSVVWPPGWKMENKTYSQNQTQASTFVFSRKALP
jgi:hypothetical protein